MQAIIFADRNGDELSPLNQNAVPAMLPSLDRPVLQHSIEALAQSGIDEIFLVVADQAGDIEAYFQKGHMWGVSIHYLLSRGEESPSKLVSRLGRKLTAPFYALRGDVLRVGDINWFVKQTAHSQEDLVCATSAGNTLALARVGCGNASLSCLAWPSVITNEKTIDHSGPTHYSDLSSWEEYHRAVLGLGSSQVSFPQYAARNATANLRMSRRSLMVPQSYEEGVVSLGEETYIDKNAKLHGPVVIGDRSYVDRGAEIRNSVVMPDTYVGAGLNVENAIISGKWLIRIDRGAVVEICDRQLASDISANASEILEVWPQRIIGAFLLTASLPLWLAALIFSLAGNPRAPMMSRLFCSNRPGERAGETRTIQLYHFATRIPILRYLPFLWAVVRGELLLFGITPSQPSQALGKDGQFNAALKGKAGVLGPRQLILARDSSSIEIELAELVFAAESGAHILLKRLAMGIRSLFRPRFWTAGGLSHV